MPTLPWLQPHLQGHPVLVPQDQSQPGCGAGTGWGNSQSQEDVLRRRGMGSLSTNKLNTYGPCGPHAGATLTHGLPVPRTLLPPPGRATRGEGRESKAPPPSAARCVRRRARISSGAVAAPARACSSTQQSWARLRARWAGRRDRSEGTQSGHQAPPSTAEEQRPHALNKKVTRLACSGQPASRGGSTGSSGCPPLDVQDPKTRVEKAAQNSGRTQSDMVV